MIKRLSIIVLALLAVSCIKEDRTKCPCNLHVDLSRVDGDYVHKVDLMLRDVATQGNPWWYAVEKRYIGDTLIIEVNKSEFDFCAWGNLVRSLKDDRSQNITPGSEPDSLWSCYRRIVTRCEDAYVTVEPERQFIPVTIIVRGMLQGISGVKTSLKGISDCFDYTGNATGRELTLVPQLVSGPDSAEGYYLFRTLLMTQPTSESAVLGLEFLRFDTKVSGVYPVGKMLLEAGEDISLRDQRPIVIELTIGSADIQVAIKINDWTTHGVFTITY